MRVAGVNVEVPRNGRKGARTVMTREVPAAQPEPEAALIEAESTPSMVSVETAATAARVETMVAVMSEMMPTEMPTVQSTVVAAVVAAVVMAAMSPGGVDRCRRQADSHSGDRHGAEDSMKSRRNGHGAYPSVVPLKQPTGGSNCSR